MAQGPRARQRQRDRATPVPLHMDFDEQVPDFAGEVGPTFELGGETFHCLACPPGGVLARLWSASRVDDRGRQVYNNPDLINFVADVLADQLPVADVADWDGEGEAPAQVMVLEDCDDVARWDTLMADKSRPIPTEVIGNVVMWLAEYYADRPTNPPAR